MIQISYLSTAAQPMSTEELLALLQQCVSNNRRTGLTGMLLYGNGTFLQTLEGDAAAVDSLFAKIGADQRHRDVKLLSRGPIERRRYSGWNMGFKRLSGPEMPRIEGLVDFTPEEFTPAYLVANPARRDALMDHFSSWDPLVRQLDEKEQTIARLRKVVTHLRGCAEIASLVLESVAASGRHGPLDEGHLRFCEMALDKLRTADVRAD